MMIEICAKIDRIDRNGGMPETDRMRSDIGVPVRRETEFPVHAIRTVFFYLTHSH